MSNLFMAIKSMIYDKKRNSPIIIMFFTATILSWIQALWIEDTSLAGTISVISFAIYLLNFIYIIIQITRQMKRLQH